jgi:hypothetical protein
MISFLAIGSREEEKSAMGERRLRWNEEGDRQGSIYIGGFILQQESKSYFYKLHTREYANRSKMYMILSWKSVERVIESMEDERS